MASPSPSASPARVAKGSHNAARFSSLDELTFNRDFDLSQSYGSQPAAKQWTFEPSYSGLAAAKLRQPTHKRLPVNMMDTFLADSATSPQIVPPGSWRTSIMIKSNPTLRGFVTDKVTNVPHTPAMLERPPLRTIRHSLVHDHEENLLVNISTPSSFVFPPGAARFDPFSRPLTTHVPGRHRFFCSDVRAKLP